MSLSSLGVFVVLPLLVVPAETPPADVLPTFFAALEDVHGTALQRVALFDDGTVVLVTRSGPEPPVVKKRRISFEERTLIRRVISEALLLSEGRLAGAGSLTDRDRRRITIEIARPERPPRVFEFDDLTLLPLALGRAKGALEDLRARFLDRSAAEKDRRWDGNLLKEGDRLKRRSDGKVFVVVRDDRMLSVVELVEEGRRLERVKVARKLAPGIFEEPLPSEPPPEPERLR